MDLSSAAGQGPRDGLFDAPVGKDHALHAFADCLDCAHDLLLHAPLGEAHELLGLGAWDLVDQRGFVWELAAGGRAHCLG